MHLRTNRTGPQTRIQGGAGPTTITLAATTPTNTPSTTDGTDFDIVQYK